MVSLLQPLGVGFGFETGFLCIALAVLVLILALNSQKCACLCIPSARIKGMRHHCLALSPFLSCPRILDKGN